MDKKALVGKTHATGKVFSDTEMMGRTVVADRNFQRRRRHPERS